MSFTPLDWLVAAVAAIIIGFSKTGVPGVGILAIPLIALLFGGRASIGATLPLLIVADVFAVVWYRKFADWAKLARIMPVVLVGYAIGTVVLLYLGANAGTGRAVNVLIGWLVLFMLGVQALRMTTNIQLDPTSRVGTTFVGVSAGFATFVSNASGPIMTIYLTALELAKMPFMGTSAMFYFLGNVIKIPVYVALTLLEPASPIFSRETLLLDALLTPLVIVGVFAGRWFLPRIHQRQFTVVVLVLSALAAIRLIVG